MPAPVAVWGRSAWSACLFWAALGLIPPAIVLVLSRMHVDLPPQMRVVAACGLLWTTSLGAYALHLATLRIAAAVDGLRIASAFGWQSVAWTDVKGIEDQTIITFHYSQTLRGLTSVSSNLADRSQRKVRLLGAAGQKLCEINREMLGQDAVVGACVARTGRPLVPRDIRVMDLESWGMTSRKP
jgi:hypothetical protein